MKVYLVCAGEYEDWRICRAFTSQERAEQFVTHAHFEPYYQGEAGPEIFQIEVDRPFELTDEQLTIHGTDETFYKIGIEK